MNAIMAALFEDEEAAGDIPSLAFGYDTGTMLSTRGSLVPVSFTRATPRSIIDFEVKPRNILSGEVPFYGLRRVYNPASGSSRDLSGGGYTRTGGGVASVPVTTAGFSLVYNGETIPATRLVVSLNGGNVATDVSVLQQTGGVGTTRTFSVVLQSNNASTYSVQMRVGGQAFIASVGPTAQRFSVTSAVLDADSSCHLGLRGGFGTSDSADILVTDWQREDVTGRANLNPSERVSVGAAKLSELIDTEAMASANWVASQAGTGVAPVKTALAVAPDGSATAAQYALNRGAGNTAGDFSAVTQNYTAPSGGSYTAGLWLKGTVGEQVGFRHAGNSGYQVVTFTGAWQFVSSTEISTGSGNFQISNRGTVTTTNSVTFLVWHPQANAGATLNPYFPVGNVYPFHGAGVDGVKYFPYENGNTVTSNVVTEATGAAIPRTGKANSRLPGLSGSYFTTPDSVANSITGDIEIRAVMVIDDLTPALANNTIIGKLHTAGTTYSYALQVTTTGLLRWAWSPTGLAANAVLKDSTVTLGSVGFGDGLKAAVAVTHDLDDGAGNNVVRFWYSLNYNPDTGVGTWIQLGASVTTAGTTTLVDTAQQVEIGSLTNGSGSMFAGSIERVQVYNGIGGTKVLDFNPADGFTENLALNSKMEGGAAAPTGWSQPTGTGTSAPDSTLASGDVVYVHTSVAQRPFIALSVGSEAGVNYRFMAYIHANPDNLTLAQCLGITNMPAGASALFSDGTAGGTTVAPIGWVWTDMIGATAVGSPLLRLGVGIAANQTGTLKFSRPQFRRLSISATTPLDNVYIQSATAATRRGWDSSATGEQWSANGGAIVNRQVPGFMPEVGGGNLVLQSENFGVTWAAAAGGTLTAAAKRVGDIVFDLLNDPNAAGQSLYSQTVTFTGDAVKAISLHVAQGSSTSSLVIVLDSTAGANRLAAALTWSNGLPVVTMTTGTLLGVDYIGSGAFRLRFATTAITAANNNSIRLYPANIIAGDNALLGTVYMGGVMAENATTCSSYVPTTTGAVTRNADQMLIGTLGSWFNPAEGTVAVAIAGTPLVNGAFVAIDDATANERIVLQSASWNSDYVVTDGGVSQVALSGSSLLAGGKISASYKLNDFELYTNGNRAGTGDQVGTVPTATQMPIGYRSTAPITSQAQTPIQSLAYYPKRIANSPLSALSP